GERSEAVAIGLLSSRGERAERAAVERLLERDDAVARFLRPSEKMAAHELDARLHGLRPRIAEKHAAHTGELRESACQLDVLLVEEVVRDVDEAPRLFRDGRNER